jgi:hypothetical protein
MQQPYQHVMEEYGCLPYDGIARWSRLAIRYGPIAQSQRILVLDSCIYLPTVATTTPIRGARWRSSLASMSNSVDCSRLVGRLCLR